MVSNHDTRSACNAILRSLRSAAELSRSATLYGASSWHDLPPKSACTSCTRLLLSAHPLHRV